MPDETCRRCLNIPLFSCSEVQRRAPARKARNPISPSPRTEPINTSRAMSSGDQRSAMSARIIRSVLDFISERSFSHGIVGWKLQIIGEDDPGARALADGDRGHAIEKA